MKLGVLSDTHGLLRQEVLNHLQGCDAILHGGDINNQGILNTLSSVAPLYVVRGNNDKEWATELPLFINEEIAGIHVYMTHKKKGLPADLNPFDLVIRFNQAITMALVTVENEQIKVQRIDIEHQEPRAKIGADLRSQIEIVMRETAKGRPAVEIAHRRDWDVSLVEQIARLYVTHPGVTADGIMAKMGV